MAGNDFFLNFGSNAAPFSRQIVSELEPAIDKIYGLAEALSDYEGAANKAKNGNSPLASLFTGLDRATAQFAQLTTQLTDTFGAALNQVSDLRYDLESLVEAVNKLPTSRGKVPKVAQAIASVTEEDQRVADSSSKASRSLAQVLEVNSTQARNALKRVADINATVARNATEGADALSKLGQTIRTLSTITRTTDKGLSTPGRFEGGGGGQQIVIVTGGGGVNSAVTSAVGASIDVAALLKQAGVSTGAVPATSEEAAATNVSKKTRFTSLDDLSKAAVPGAYTVNGGKRYVGRETKPGESFGDYFDRYDKQQQAERELNDFITKDSESRLGVSQATRISSVIQKLGKGGIQDDVLREVRDSPGSTISGGDLDTLTARVAPRVSSQGLSKADVDLIPQALQEYKTRQSLLSAGRTDLVQGITSADPHATFAGLSPGTKAVGNELDQRRIAAEELAAEQGRPDFVGASERQRIAAEVAEGKANREAISGARADYDRAHPKADTSGGGNLAAALASDPSSDPEVVARRNERIAREAAAKQAEAARLEAKANDPLVTLFRGENASNKFGGRFYTDDVEAARAYALKGAPDDLPDDFIGPRPQPSVLRKIQLRQSQVRASGFAIENGVSNIGYSVPTDLVGQAETLAEGKAGVAGFKYTAPPTPPPAEVVNATKALSEVTLSAEALARQFDELGALERSGAFASNDYADRGVNAGKTGGGGKGGGKKPPKGGAGEEDGAEESAENAKAQRAAAKSKKAAGGYEGFDKYLAGLSEETKALLAETKVLLENANALERRNLLAKAGAALLKDSSGALLPNADSRKAALGQALGLDKTGKSYSELTSTFQRGGFIDQVPGLRQSINGEEESAGGGGASVAEQTGGQKLRESLFGKQGFAQSQLRHTGRAIENIIGYQLVFTGFEKLKELVQTGLEAEAAFVRLQASLTANGIAAGSLRSDLVGISGQTATSLHDVIGAASELVGVFSNAGDLAFGTKIAAQLSNISYGALTAKEAATALRDVIDAYGLSGTASVQAVGDSIAALSQQTGVGVKDIAEGTANLAPEAHAYGLSQRQASVLSAYVTRATGETGEAASEQVSRVLSTLNNGKVQDELVHAGVATRAQFQQGNTGGVLTNLLSEFKQLPPATQQAITALIGSGRQARAFFGLMQDGAAAAKEFNGTQDDMGALARQNAAILATPAGQLKKLSEDFQNIGSTLQQAGLLNLLGLLAKTLDVVFVAFNSTFGGIARILDGNSITSALKNMIALVAELAIAWKLLGATNTGERLGTLASNLFRGKAATAERAAAGSAIGAVEAEGAVVAAGGGTGIRAGLAAARAESGLLKSAMTGLSTAFGGLSLTMVGAAAAAAALYAVMQEIAKQDANNDAARLLTQGDTPGQETVNGQKDANNKTFQPGIGNTILDIFKTQSQGNISDEGNKDIQSIQDTAFKQLRKATDSKDPAKIKAAQKHIDEFIKAQSSSVLDVAGDTNAQAAAATDLAQIRAAVDSAGTGRIANLAAGKQIDVLLLEQATRAGQFLASTSSYNNNTLSTFKVGIADSYAEAGVPVGSSTDTAIKTLTNSGTNQKDRTAAQLVAQKNLADAFILKLQDPSIGKKGDTNYDAAVAGRDSAIAAYQTAKTKQDTDAFGVPQAQAALSLSQGSNSGALAASKQALAGLQAYSKTLVVGSVEYINNLKAIQDAKFAIAQQEDAPGLQALEVSTSKTLNAVTIAKAAVTKALAVVSESKNSTPQAQADAAVALNAAHIQVAQANAAQATSVTNLAAQYATFRGDAVSASSSKVKGAEDALKVAINLYGQGSAEANNAQAALLQAQQQLNADALAAINGALELQIAQLNARGKQGDAEAAARDKVKEAQNALKSYQKRGGKAGTAEYDKLVGDIATAQRSAFDTALQAQLDTLDFQRQTYAITSAQEVASLQAILKNKQLTLKEQRDITLKIKDLQTSIREQLTGAGFNIPSDIKLPTAYDVRRSLGAGFSGAGTSVNNVTHNNQQVQINNNVPTAQVAAQIAQSVISLLNQQTGQAVRASSSSPRLVPTR